jgi:predicted phosphodiesterase
MLESSDVDVLICGHTHKPYHRVIEGIHIINDGSVGKPKDGISKACYALIDFGDTISVNFRRLLYPIDEVVKEILKVGLPEAFAEALWKGN